MRYDLSFSQAARRWLTKLARQNPGNVEDIRKKIKWLCENVESLSHEKL